MYIPTMHRLRAQIAFVVMILALGCAVHAQSAGPTEMNQTWWFFVPPKHDSAYGRACPEIGWKPYWNSAAQDDKLW